MKQPKLWYVVLNGHEARIMHDLLDSSHPVHAESVVHGPERSAEDIWRDRPTRSFASARTGRRSAVAPSTDARLEDSRGFLRQVFEHLEHNRQAGAFDGLVLVGSPHMVGLWREMVPKSLEACLRREIVRNLLSTPPAHLADALRDTLKLD
ncbi:host attachment protein [Salipiger pacificus]|uniref:Host attachment protein n=2 Tax=Salipiger mangrovisoli TaxID=2865933 RepID=A0ABR9X5A9_9RHOB|nr:host attachment protein [Salipiger mangrovisoli]MBE9638788.1 host attachment protein [Salipiger mangrovisoli]